MNLAALDLNIFRSINGLAGHWSALDAFAIFMAAYSQYVWFAVLAGLGLRSLLHRTRSWMLLTLGVGAAGAARWSAKMLIARTRPYQVLTGVHPLIAAPIDEVQQSFPSGHATFFFALATVLYAYDRRLGRWAFAAAVVMGMSRVYVGVHWPSDILGGALIGMATGWLVVKVWRSLERRS